jgi:hypothetical protein
MATLWRFLIDWDRNGNFTGIYDNVAPFVLNANWFVGSREAYVNVGDDSMFELILNNADRRFSPENTASPLYGKIAPFRPVRVESFDGTTTRIHWTGWIEKIEPMVNTFGERKMTLLASGVMQFLQEAQTQLPLQEEQYTDEIIAKLLTEVVIPPALSQAWVVGNMSYGELGLSTILADVSALYSLDDGVVQLPYAGDNWTNGDDTYDTYRAMDDVVSAERGRFFFNRQGQGVFWNRLRLQDEIVPSATFNNSMNDLVYSYAGPEDLKNEIVVNAHPRTVSPNTDDLLWQLDKEVTIAANKEQKISVKYTDKEATEARIGAKEAYLTQVTFQTGTATVTFESSANGGELLVKNTTNKNVILKTAAIRGRKITDFGKMEATAQDLTSVTFFGRRQMRLNLRSVDNLEYAQQIADYELARRKDPKGYVKHVTLRSHATEGGNSHPQQLALTIGSVVVISESQTGHDSQRYVIIGEAHRLSDAGQLYETTWYLEPTRNNQFPWKLGTSSRGEVGTVTRLAF